MFIGWVLDSKLCGSTFIAKIQFPGSNLGSAVLNFDWRTWDIQRECSELGLRFYVEYEK